MVKALLSLLLPLVILPLLWLVGLVWFIASIGTLQAASSVKTEAIVVLTGGSERLEEGIALLKAEYAGALFVSGAGGGATARELLESIHVPEEEAETLLPRIELGHHARDTRENAEEVASWMRGKGFRSLRLVTSNYHMPRSLLELRAELPDAEVVPHAVNPDQVKLEAWWHFPGTRGLVVSEYNKLLLATLKRFVQRRREL